MKIFTKVLTFFSFFVSILSSAIIFVDDPAMRHEVYDKCDYLCEHTCATLHRKILICPRICVDGYICANGFVRAYKGGPCIHLSECPRLRETRRS